MNKKQITLFATNISLKPFQPYAEERCKYYTFINNYLSNQSNLLNVSFPRSAMIKANDAYSKEKKDINNEKEVIYKKN